MVKSKYVILTFNVDSNDVKLLSRSLSKDVYKILGSFSDMECISIIRNHNIDLIILGVYIDSLSGIEIYHALKAKKETQTIPIIIQTKFNTMVEKLTALRLDIADYIFKPMNIDIATNKVKNQIKNIKVRRRITELILENKLLRQQIEESKTEEIKST